MERSGQQYAPTVNIVISYDAEAMINFSEMGDFSAFVNYRNEYNKKRKAQLGDAYIPQTHVFNNSPNSTFISLKHEVAGEAKDSTLELEILDPQGVFEESMLDNNLQSFFDIKDNPIGAALLDKSEDLLFLKSERELLLKEKADLKNSHKESPIARLKEIDDRTAQLEDTIDSITNKSVLQDSEGNDISFPDLEAIQEGNLDILRKQIEAQTTQFQRPVYISYGMGDSLKDWSPIQCYNRVTKLEYSFTGDGVRSFKLIFAGIGIHPNLTEHGVKPFGSLFAKGLLTTGYSSRIFNDEASEQQGQDLKKILSSRVNSLQLNKIKADNVVSQFFSGDEIDKQFGRGNKPSLHLVVKEALEDFIRNGSNYENVLVALPDLDHLLADYLSESIRNVSFRVKNAFFKNGAPDDLYYFRGFEEALQGLGLMLVETLPRGTTSVVGTNIIGSLEECSCSENTEKWFDSRNIKAVIQCDYVNQTFLEKLRAVGNAISNKITQYNSEATKVEMMESVEVEADFELLRLMKRATIIPSTTKPLLLWGDRTFVENYLYAFLLESLPKQEEDVSKSDILGRAQESISQNVHPIDELRGIDLGYMKAVLNHIQPLPWVGPFGPQNSGQADEFALKEDVNISKESLNTLKKNQPLTLGRLPVFTFGTRNSNILSIDLDINNYIFAALNMANSTAMSSQSSVAGLIPPNFQDTAQRIFKEGKFDVTSVDENNIPEGFKVIVNPFYDSDWYNADNIQNFDDWAAIFERLDPNVYKNMADMEFPGISAREDFYKYMWTSFQALYSKVHPTPTSIRNIPGSDPEKKILSTNVSLVNRISEAAIKGSITTTPIFNLASKRRVLSRPCLLYCVEPRISKATDEGDIKRNHTWFSGQYIMTGWKHEISSDRVQSSFQVIRTP